MFRNIFMAASLGILYFTTLASADTVFNDQATFLAATNPSNFESFESFAPVDTDLPVLNLADFTITDLNSVADELKVEDTDFDVHATDGDQYVYWYVLSLGGGLRFNFSRPINAFGVTLTDAADQGSDTISYATDGGSAGTVLTGPLPDSNEVFWGIQTDSPISFAELTFSHSGGFDAVGLDELYFNQVPEPASLGLLLGGVAAGLGILRRRLRLGGV